ncbi:MAG: tape measure protein [Blastomonas sp.]
MAEIDPVILSLRAEVDKYIGDVRRATKTVDQQLGIQERKTRDLEAQMRKSSGAISTSIKGLAATFATAFTGRELIGLIDGFTRLQNSLRVAGLEGQALADVQGRLLELSSKYGVGIESLAGLFGNSTQAASEFNATQSQLLALTEATAQSLKITGTSATQAQGAILGLTQALASGTVRAEEFNQINEGGLRPLLQLAANTDEFGGSVAKLRNAVVDGKLSSEEFFQAIVNGGDQLDAKASKAVLTISGAFEALNSQLTVYVGSAAAANGATGAIAAGIQALADNLDLAANALAVIGAAMLGRYVGPMVSARIATLATSASLATYTGAVAIATRQVGVLAGAQVALTGAMAGTRVAAAGLLAVLGGPVGIAITALALGLGYVASESAKAEQEFAALEQRTADLKAKLDDANVSVRQTGDAAKGANPLVVGIGNAYRFAGDQAAYLAKNAKIAALATLQADRLKVRSLLPSGPESGPAAAARRFVGVSDRRVEELRAKDRELTSLINRTVNAPDTVFAAPVAAPKATAPVAPGGGGSGAASRAARGADLRDVARAVDSSIDRLKDAGGSIADALRAVNDFTRNQFDLATSANQNEQDLLRASLVLAETRSERAEIERRLITLQFSQERAEQELVLATLGSSETAQKVATARLAVLDALEAQARTESALANQSPGQQFLRSIELSGKNIDDQFEGVAVNGLQNLNDQLVDAIFNAESLADVFSNVAKSIIADLIRIAIQQAIIAPLANSLFGGGGGGFGAALGSIFGRSSGGYVAPGQAVRVNEGASPGRVEGFVGPSTGGQIVPLGRMDAARGGAQAGGTVRIVIEEREGFASQVQSMAQGVAIDVVRQASGPIIETAVNETNRRSRRPRL